MHHGLCVYVCVCVCQREECTTEFVCPSTNYCTNVLRADLGDLVTENILDNWGTKRENDTTRST